LEVKDVKFTNIYFMFMQWTAVNSEDKIHVPALEKDLDSTGLYVKLYYINDF